MSDIEREEFEQAVTDRWSDSYSFTRFGDEDYYDEVLEGMWWGWQASRQEGEPIGFLQSSGVSQLSGGHPAKLYPIGATPSPFESSTLVYTNPARDGQESVTQLSELMRGLEIGPGMAAMKPHGFYSLGKAIAEQAKKAASVPQQWRDTMEELAADLESEIENRRSGDLDRRIERDLIVVREARALLAEQEQGHE